MTEATSFTSSVYGPVHSWRVGNSLGIDLLMQTSICSFNCVYCQLGHIQRITQKQDVYVPTEKVMEDLQSVNWDEVDVVTFSGNGEPTLALNLEEVVDYIKDNFQKPVVVLTNATMLTDEATRQRLRRVDIVACKLDAVSDEILQRVNRPVDGITLERIIEGIKALKAENFPGKIALQCMFMPMNKKQAAELAELIADIEPDEVQLNTPKRPYPKEWYLESRGNHTGELPVKSVNLKTISLEEAEEIEKVIRERNPSIPVLSVYRHAPKD